MKHYFDMISAAFPGKGRLTIPEGGSILGFKKSKSYKMAAKGELPTTTIGGCQCTTPALLAQYMADRDAKARRR
jgi:hypothetical protein